jgi:hypothetical protein
LHASQICNNFILSHFSFEASLLRSEIRDGWLVPTHRAILLEESLLLERKRRACRVCGQGVSRFSLQTLIPEPDILLDQEACPHYPSFLSPDCGDRDHAELRFGLSTPGPQYMRFLEEYGRELRIRGELAGLLTATPISDMSSLSDEGNSEESSRETEFEWQISTYAVRPYLRRLDLLRRGDGSCGISCDVASSASTITPQRSKISLGRKIIARTFLGKILGLETDVKQERKRVFGELPQGSRERIMSEIREKDGFWRDDTSAALLWYFGIDGVGGLGPPSPTSMSLVPPAPTEEKVTYIPSSLSRDYILRLMPRIGAEDQR